MSGLSNAQLAAQVSDLLTRWNAREDQVQDWLGGTATGGPEGDGRYPLSNARGDTNLIPCPAALAATASGPAAVALGHRDGAEAAAGVATTQADRSEAQRVLAESAKAASLAARDLTLQYRDRAANAEANAEVHRQYAEAARVGTAADLEATGDHRDAAEYAAAQAENHKVDAAASAAAAGNYNPALYATRADGLSQIAGLQAALDARLLASGFTWAALPGKPSTFAPSAHGHVISDVTGLQAALDGKQAAGSYAAATHGHVISDVTGLQAALDAKVTSGSAGSLSSLTVGAPGGTTGIIYLGQNQTAPAYLYWDGGSYAMPSGPLLVNGSQVWTAATFDPATKASLAAPSFIGSATVTNSGSGYVYLNAGSATASGYIAFHKVDGTRRGYIGFGNDSTVEFAAENGALFRFNHRPVFNGQTPWDSGNFTPASKLDTSEAATANTPNSIVRRDSNGYVHASWFDANSGGVYSSSSGVHFDVGGQAWGASLYANHSSVQLALRTAGAVTRGHVYADNGNTIGFLNNDANWALQLQKTGPSFLRVNNVLRSIWTSDDMAVHSARDFVNGTLVATDLNYPQGSGEAFILEIRGNGYGGSLPFDTVIQGYIYNNTIIAVSGISNGAHITGMVALGVGGKLCFWWPRLAYWQGFNVKVYFAQAGEAARNRVTSITDVVKPSGTAEVNITANVAASWTSANFDPGTKFDTSGGTLTGSISTTYGADRFLMLGSSTSYNYQLIAAGDHFQIREASDPSKVRFAINYPNGNVGMGTTNPLARLHLSYTNPVSVPAAGASGHAFAAGTTGYGLAAGVLTSGNSYIQSTRWDGTATNYPLMLQPNGGATRVGDDLQFDKVRSGMVGVYDAAQTQAIWAMGPSYTLTPGGASNQIGPLYGLAWSYEPNYGGSGNNPQSKTGLYHQLLLMNNGTTLTALGQGIWTAGRIECAGNGGWTMGSYADKNRIDYDGSKFRFLNSGNVNAAVEMASLTVNGSINASGELTFAGGNVYTSGGLIYNASWWRSTGQSGWFNATYSTGIWSITGGEVRTYNGSRFHSEGNLSSGGVIISASDGGFQNAGYVSGRNRIWSFANADAYGLSYYQGAGGWGGMDTINFHFGNTAEASTLHKFRSDGVAAHAGDLYVKGSRLPVFTSSTGAPSGGVDGDIHITY